MISVQKIETEEQLAAAFAIRRKVFVEEQEVSPEEEYDEFEDSSEHFLATDEKGTACGTARWRFTDKGMKLERFAVLKAYRGKGVGSALVAAVLNDIAENNEAAGKLMYMHAQLDAMPLYAKFDFEKVGPQFDECGIQHFKMQKQND